MIGSESGAVKTALPQVVFVDDDEAIRRLVASVLEDLPIVLRCCASVAEARAALREQPAQLVITDLMLPVETGFDLLESFVTEPALRAGAHLAVFSAGLNAATRARLAGLDVWRELAKPVSLQALEDCVNDALALAPHLSPPGPGAAMPPTDAATPRTGGELLAHEERAIAAQFGGDAALYLAFRSQVQVQFVEDIREGERSLTLQDWPALHRLAHSLKGVLLLLGDEPGASLAGGLEMVAEAAAAAAAAADTGACLQGWQALAGHLNSGGLVKNQIRSD